MASIYIMRKGEQYFGFGYNTIIASTQQLICTVQSEANSQSLTLCKTVEICVVNLEH